MMLAQVLSDSSPSQDDLTAWQKQHGCRPDPDIMSTTQVFKWQNELDNIYIKKLTTEIIKDFEVSAPEGEAKFVGLNLRDHDL